MHSFRLRFLLCFAISFASCSTNEEPADVAIQNVTLIDAKNGLRENQTVLVTDGLISDIKEAAQSFLATEVIDGSGKYLIPGLWDFHVHLTYDERFTETMPALFLYHGVTSVRDTGGPLDLLLPVVESMRAANALSPRVFFSGPLMDGEFVVYDGENNPLLGIANPDTMTARENVSLLDEAGVDFVKVYEMVSPEVFEAIVQEAKKRGLPIAGHVPLSMKARDVGPHVQSLEHLRNIEMDCIEASAVDLEERRRLLANENGLSGGELRTKLHQTFRIPSIRAYEELACQGVMESMMSTTQVPTLRLTALNIVPPYKRSDWESILDKLPGEVATEWRAMSERHLAAGPFDLTFPKWSLFLTNLMHQAGVPIGAGTDSPIALAAPGYSLHNELEMLVQAGLSPLEALGSATLRPAEFFGMEDEMGIIETGYLADLVLLADNPLEDISNTRSILAVVTKGELLNRKQLDDLLE